MYEDRTIADDQWEQVELLDRFRKAADALSQFVERMHDVARNDEINAGTRRKMGHYTIKEGNERMPPIPPDRPPGNNP